MNFHSFSELDLGYKMRAKIAQILKENRSLFHECIDQSPGRDRRACSVGMGGWGTVGWGVGVE